jgi:hypothetical protein
MKEIIKYHKYHFDNYDKETHYDPYITKRHYEENIEIYTKHIGRMQNYIDEYEKYHQEKSCQKENLYREVKNYIIRVGKVKQYEELNIYYNILDMCEKYSFICTKKSEFVSTDEKPKVFDSTVDNLIGLLSFLRRIYIDKVDPNRASDYVRGELSKNKFRYRINYMYLIEFSDLEIIKLLIELDKITPEDIIKDNIKYLQYYFKTMLDNIKNNINVMTNISKYILYNEIAGDSLTDADHLRLAEYISNSTTKDEKNITEFIEQIRNERTRLKNMGNKNMLDKDDEYDEVGYEFIDEEVSVESDGDNQLQTGGNRKKSYSYKYKKYCQKCNYLKKRMN